MTASKVLLVGYRGKVVGETQEKGGLGYVTSRSVTVTDHFSQVMKSSLADCLSILRTCAMTSLDATMAENPPTLLVPVISEPVSKRSTRTDEVVALVAKLEEQSTLFGEITAMMDEARAVLRARSNAMRQMLAPVSCLPIEVLREIFLLAASSPDLTNYYNKGPLAAASISAVCKQWREVAISCPALWHSVHTASNQNPEAFRTWASRAQQPMEVTLFHGYNRDLRCAEAIASTPRQVAKLTLELAGNEYVPFVLQSLSNDTEQPRHAGFHQMTIRGFHDELKLLDEPLRYHVDLQDPEFPHMREFRLEDVVVTGVLENNVVEVLDCSRVTIDGAIWEGMDNLRTLHFASCDLGDHAELEDEPLALPQLSTLSLLNCTPELVDFVLQNTFPPKLRHVSLSINPSYGHRVWVGAFRTYVMNQQVRTIVSIWLLMGADTVELHNSSA